MLLTFEYTDLVFEKITSNDCVFFHFICVRYNDFGLEYTWKGIKKHVSSAWVSFLLYIQKLQIVSCHCQIQRNPSILRCFLGILCLADSEPYLVVYQNVNEAVCYKWPAPGIIIRLRLSFSSTLTRFLVVRYIVQLQMTMYLHNRYRRLNSFLKNVNTLSSLHSLHKWKCNWNLIFFNKS